MRHERNRRWVGVAVATCSLLVCAVGAIAENPVDRSIVARSVVGLSATGDRGAQIRFLERPQSESCGVVRVWLLSPRLERRVSPRCAAGSRLYGLTGTRDEVEWASRNAGATTLWLSSYDVSDRTFSAPRALARTAPGAPAIVVGDNGGIASGFAIGRRVTYRTEALRRSWTLPSPVLSLAVDAPYLVASEQDGAIDVFLQGAAPHDPVPAARFTYAPGSVRAFEIDGQRLAVLRRGELDVRPIYGSQLDTFALPAATSYGDDQCGRPNCPSAELRLADFDGNLVVYVLHGEIHVLRMTDGRDVVARRAREPLHAELQPSGLAYSSAGRISVVPRKELNRLVAR